MVQIEQVDSSDPPREEREARRDAGGQGRKDCGEADRSSHSSGNAPVLTSITSAHRQDTSRAN